MSASRTEQERRSERYAGLVSRMRDEVERIGACLDELPPADGLMGPPDDDTLAMLMEMEVRITELRVTVDQMGGVL